MTHLPDPDRQPEFYASVPTKRFIAWVIDAIFIGTLCVLIGLLTATVAFWFFPLLLLIVSFVYRVITIAGSSATWGMRLMNIEFRKNDGTKFDAGTALFHTLGYVISFSLPVLQAVSVILMVVSGRGQGLSDMVLGSTAVNRRAIR